ncbi:MAG TPA: glycosyltransferase family 2 protein [Pyrinomonadaceae bacterium]|nr:glycosyltransferase family 2 protein [Pyrinomonadaceae bacterium]
MPELESTIFLLVFAWSIVGLWLGALLRTWFCLKKLKPLELNKTAKNESKPLVSIIVPARNEAHRVLEKSIRSMITQTYENFEIIILDDRSTDDTKEIIEKVFAEQSKIQNPKFKIIFDGIELPANWLGKPFALHQALKHSRGEWIITADADIIFAPETLQTVVDYVETNRFDALTLAPKLMFQSFWETLFMPTFAWFCLLAMPLHLANDAKRKESVGFGNFFMFRRDVLDEIGGFEAVKSEVAEDLKLAEILKQKGFNLRADYAPKLIETRMYAGFREIWQGFTKNLFSGMKFSFPKTIFSLFSILIFGVLPSFLAISVLAFGQFTLFAPLVSIYCLQTAVFILVQKNWFGNQLFAFLTPLGLLMFLLILANSTVKVLSGKGVTWKGRAIYERGGIEPPVK